MDTKNEMHITIDISDQIEKVVVSYFFLHTKLPFINVFITVLGHMLLLISLILCTYILHDTKTKSAIISKVLQIVV